MAVMEFLSDNLLNTTTQIKVDSATSLTFTGDVLTLKEQLIVFKDLTLDFQAKLTDADVYTLTIDDHNGDPILDYDVEPILVTI